MTNIQRADDAHAAHKQIISLRDLSVRTFLKLGEVLYLFKESEMWLDLDHASFNSYLADPQVDIKRAWAYRLMGVYQKYVVELDCLAARLIEVGPDKLTIIKPYVTEENAEELLATASTNSRSTLRDMYSSVYEPQNGNSQSKFAKFTVSYHHFYRELQNLLADEELLKKKPELRKDILAIGTALEDLKEKVNVDS